LKCNRIFEITISSEVPFRADFVISYIVRAATDTAVSASISTPVWATVFASLEIRTDESEPGEIFTRICDKGTGWHSGMRDDVFLAAMTPAIREISIILPFVFIVLLDSKRCAKTRLGILTAQLALAIRTVESFAETSTIPFACVNMLPWLEEKSLRAGAILDLTHVMRAGIPEPPEKKSTIPTSVGSSSSGGAPDESQQKSRDCASQKNIYDTCFRNWYRYSYLRENFDDPCDKHFQEYNSCLKSSLSTKGLGELPDPNDSIWKYGSD
jgi:hypothetical protein